MAEGVLQLFGGDWTDKKLDALHQYLVAYVKALSKQPFELYYIDAFAGTGYREQRANKTADGTLPFEQGEDLAEDEPQRFLAGSASKALQVKRPFHRYIFIEISRQRAAELEKLKQEHPQLASAIDVRCQDANAAIQSICHDWDCRNARGVLFLDPFGMQVDWKTIEAVAATGTIDVWILFPFALNRLLKQRVEAIPQSWRERLNRMLGTEDWVNRFYQERVVEDLFTSPETVREKDVNLQDLGSYYKERLNQVFPVVAPNPLVLRNSRNSPLFQLFFAAGNRGQGGKIALRIAKDILGKM
jgi:three-Cys-motif partner protein